VKAPIKGILKKPPPPPANFNKLSPDPKETPVLLSPLVAIKTTLLPSSIIILCSIKVTINKEHLFATAYSLNFELVLYPLYTIILVNIAKELNLKRYIKPVLILIKWSCLYGPIGRC
jgi:hypothetical protein